MLDSKLQKLKHHFGIAVPEDWQEVDPLWILRVDGCGQKTLDYIRVLLAVRGLTLRNDRTPEYWNKNLPNVKLLEEMGDSELVDEGQATDTGVICPFTVFIDSAEQHPFTFLGLTTDADQGNRPLIVNTEWRALGRGESSMGDYSIDGYVGRVAIERKSMEDAHSTILGWGGRRERFEIEIQNLSEIHRAAVVVECSEGTLLRNAPQWGKKTAKENEKSLFRSVLSWQMKYPNVIVKFLDDRRLAEIWTFHFLRKYWKWQEEEKRAELKALKVATTPLPMPAVSTTQAMLAAESNLLF